MFTWFIATAKWPAIPNEPSSPKPNNPTVAEASLQEFGTFKQDAPIKHSAVEDSIYLQLLVGCILVPAFFFFKLLLEKETEEKKYVQPYGTVRFDLACPL